MTWDEFRHWARSEGLYVPYAVGGTGDSSPSRYVSILRIDRTGSGNHRKYGATHQRRLAMYEAIRRVMGIGDGKWWLAALDLAESHPHGWVYHGPHGTWWADTLDTIPHLGVGVFAAPIWRP